ncbi:MAG: hypothetical protein RL094_396 [Candidatus Parcubacteria bacterium]|jgi:hypothetical protein
MKTQRVSALTKAHQAERAYVATCIRNPDKGSAFDLKTRWFRNWLPDWVLLVLMNLMGYDGLLFHNDAGEFIGHVFFQKEQQIWKVFSVYVPEKFRGNGYSIQLIACFMQLAIDNDDIFMVRLGNGNNAAIHHIWENKIPSIQALLKVSITKGNQKGAIFICRE